MKEIILRILLVIYLIVIGSQAFSGTPYVYSQDFDYELSGVIYEQPTLFDIDDDSLLNPNNDILDLSDWTNRLYGRISFNLHYKGLKFITQTRPTIFYEDEGHEDIDFITDDAYLDMAVGEGFFLYVGKRNMRDVVAYGANPTDFLGENKEVDYTKREEERRVERKGNYLIGGETFLKNITLSATYAPEIDRWQDEKDRILLRGNLFAESINTDMSLHLYFADIPGIGFDISSTLSDNLVLYAESAFRKGSERKKEIRILNPGSADVPRTYEIIDLDNDDKVYPHIVVGGSYTFGDGTNLVCEYIYNGDGYSGNEWDEVAEFIKYNNDAYRNNVFRDLAMGYLADATAIVHLREARKNYVFFRLSNSTLVENVDAQLVFMLNADDMSFLTFPSIDYKVGTNTVVGLSSTIFAGENDSEFGMMYWSNEISLVLKYFF